MDTVALLVLAHLAGTIIAVGGATVSDALFFRTIKNRRVSRDEFKLLNEAGKVIWSGLALAVFSGLALIIMEWVHTGGVARLGLGFFQLKVLLVGVVAINGIIFHTRVLPFLEKHLREDMRERQFVQKYWLFALTGAISIISWWSIVILAIVNPPLPFLYLLNVYLVAVVFASLVAFLLFSHQLFGTREIKEDFGVLPAVLRYAGIALVLVLILVGLSHLPVFQQAAPAHGETHSICVTEAPPWFDPPVLNIQPGDTVVWEHCDEPTGAHNPIHTHPIEQIAGPEYFSSGFGLVGHGDRGHGHESDHEHAGFGALPFNHTFTEVGENTYICPTHPYMMGVVSVGEESDAVVWPKESRIDPDLIGTPDVAGVGEVWLNAQYHLVPGQDFPGSIPVLNTETWEIEDVITHENFNNPHNPWPTYDYRYVFQTQWHADKISKIDVATREVVADKAVGNAPAHLFVHPTQDLLYVTMNNEDRVGVYDFDLNHFRDIHTSFGAHGIWIDPQGQWMSVAATLEQKLDIIDLETEEVVFTTDAPGFPLGTQITHDGRYAMVNLLLEGVTRFVDLETFEVTDVDVGEQPIWAMPDPRNEYVFVTNTGTADITVISLDTLEVVATLPAGAGAHGIIFGEHAAGGYYGYVSHKYEPYLGVVDLDSLETIAYIPLDEAHLGGNGLIVMPSTYTRWMG